jgi:transcriptional regulator of arginine metabolism
MVDLLRKGPIQSQENLAGALSRWGESVTQATVSRDLAAIGAVRGPDGYRLPEALGDVARVGDYSGDAGGEVRSEIGGEVGPEIGGMVRRHVVSVVAAHAMVVVKTAPAHAQMVATAFDRWPPRGVEGTLAGDDTIFLATTGPKVAERVARALNLAMGGSGGSGGSSGPGGPGGLSGPGVTGVNGGGKA